MVDRQQKVTKKGVNRGFTINQLKELVENGRDILLTTREVTDILAVSINYIFDLITKGEIKVYRLKRKYRIPASEVLKLIREHTPKGQINS